MVHEEEEEEENQEVIIHYLTVLFQHTKCHG
jgi:hypothetical protein